MKKILKNGIIYLIFAIVFFGIALYQNKDKINVPYFNKMNKNVSVDVIFKKNISKVFFNGVEQPRKKIDENHYLFSNDEINQDVQKITFDNVENIEKIIVYNGNEAIFPNKIENEIIIDNSKTFLDKVSISFLSFFYNFKFYILSYIFLFLFLVNFKGKINHKILFIGILFLGLFLRLTQLNFIPFWDDEMYTLIHTAKKAPLLDLFNDPGNPPLYYIFFKIYRTLFQNSEFYRISSVILGVCFNVCFYFYIKQFLGKTKALIGMFIPTISLLVIYLSQELRCYMLLMLLAVCNAIFLFKFNKHKKAYLFCAIAIMYTHFYGVFYVLYNLIFGLFAFKKNINKLKVFLVYNLIAFVSFLPILIYKFSSLKSDFNSWMTAPRWLDYYETFNVFCLSQILLLIFLPILIVVYLKTKKTTKIFLQYNFLAIVAVFIFASVFSYLVKPVFFYKYFCVVYPCYIALLCVIITHEFKNKLISIAQFVCFVIFLINPIIHYQNLFCNHNIFFEFIKNDLNPEKNNYIFVSDTLKGQELSFKNTKIVFLPVNIGISEIDLGNFLDGSGVFYIHNLYISENVIKKANKIDLYKSPLGVFARVEYK